MSSAASSGIPVTPIPARDRRRGNRQPLGVVGILTELNSDKQLQVSVLNISPQGCAFRAPVMFRPGVVYIMRIGAGPLHLTSTIRIISSRDGADGLFDVGAKFV